MEVSRLKQGLIDVISGRYVRFGRQSGLLKNDLKRPEQDADQIAKNNVSLFTLMGWGKSLYGRLILFYHSFFKDLRA